MRPPQDTSRLLELLHEARLPIVVVGGVAAVAHGSTMTTRDLDVAMEFSAENLRTLLATLAPYRPRHATRPDLGVIASTEHAFTDFRLLLLDTDLGRLDVLAEVEPLGSPSDLRTVEMELVDGRTFRVLSLDDLIVVTAHVGRGTDRIVEQALRAIRERLGSR
jgi:hypothetical protein